MVGRLCKGLEWNGRLAEVTLLVQVPEEVIKCNCKVRGGVH